MPTMQEIIDATRAGLNDSSATDSERRWPDAELNGYLNEFIDVAKVRHASWFFGQYTSLPADVAIDGNWPIDRMYVPAARFYMIARANGKDNEEAYGQAVALYLKISDGAS